MLDEHDTVAGYNLRSPERSHPDGRSGAANRLPRLKRYADPLIHSAVLSDGGVTGRQSQCVLIGAGLSVFEKEMPQQTSKVVPDYRSNAWMMACA